MEFNLSRSIHYYYIAIISFLVLGVGLGVQYYWSKGPVNVENISSVFEASMLLDKVKKEDPLKRIKTLVDSDRVRDGIKSMERFEKETKRLNRIKTTNEYENFNTSLSNTKKALNSLLSFPDLSTVIIVFGNKLTQFENFAVQNRWRTLTRMSRRIKAKIDPDRVRGPGFFNYSKIKTLSEGIDSDIEAMNEVTLNSVLSRNDKNIVITKLRTLKTELAMLTNYIKALKQFNESFEILEKDYQNWIKQAGPMISLKKIEFERSSQNLLFSLFGLIGFLLASGVVGIFLYKVHLRKASEYQEELVLKYIKNALIPLENRIKDETSQKFKDELENYREYVHKRMSFGNVFKDSIPFSSILLDNNLNLVWANNLFYDDWGLKDFKNSDDPISWDYLQQFTNLGENDPIISALKENVAGIYQIQVKTKNHEETLPYEMYVTPVDYAGQTRIMIFFYPLRSLEETLTHQNKSLVGPISRTLDALVESRFTSEFQEKIRSDYEIAGISNIYDKFQRYNDYVVQQKMGLLSEIERLENNLYDQFKLVDDIKAISLQDKLAKNDSIGKFQNVKKGIVEIVSMRNELEDLYQGTIVTAKNLFKDQVNLLDKSKKADEIISENLKAFKTVMDVRDNFKELKGQVDDFRSRVLQVLDQAMIFFKGNSDSRVDQGLSKIKVEIKGLDKVLADFSKVVTSLDVGLSKVQMIMEQNKSPDFTELSKKFEQSREQIESDMFQLSKMAREGEQTDEAVVSSLKGLYTSFQRSRQFTKDFDELVTESMTQEVPLAEGFSEEAIEIDSAPMDS